MAGALDELHRPDTQPPLLTDRLRGSAGEEHALVQHVDNWLGAAEVDLATRLDGLAWVVQSLAQANLANVRDRRFNDLLDVLFAALPEELDHHPLSPATSRQKKMLRQAVFARTEDPRLGTIARQGRLRTTLAQLSRNRRFKSGRGMSPVIGAGWHAAELGEVETIAPAEGADDRAMIDDLLTRWLRATVLGARGWGAGYYGWPMITGLQAMMLNVACAGWLARLHAAGRIACESQDQQAAGNPRFSLTIADVRAAIGRIDRTAGRARWLGSSAERLRLGFLHADDGLRRLIATYPCT
jgi:hypothetical protein